MKDNNNTIVVKMNNEVQKFIEDNIELIQNNEFTKLYQLTLSAYRGLPSSSHIGKLTECFLSCDIDPLKYMEIVPDNYLYGSSKITSIIIPDNIMHIADNAFMSSKIESITLHSTLKSIEENVFWQCNKLKKINFIGDNLEQFANIYFKGPGANPLQQQYHQPEFYFNNVNLRDLGYVFNIDNNYTSSKDYWNNTISLEYIGPELSSISIYDNDYICTKEIKTREW